jgi:hypothetical protein
VRGGPTLSAGRVRLAEARLINASAAKKGMMVLGWSEQGVWSGLKFEMQAKEEYSAPQSYA